MLEEKVLQKIKLVCSDIDGTLVEEGKGNLNPEYYKEILRLRDKGIRFAVISGRSYESAKPLFEPVASMIWFINDNGASIRFQDQLIRSHTVEPKLVEEIVRDMESNPACRTYLSTMIGSFAQKDDQVFCQMLRRDYGLQILEVERMPEDIPADAGVMSFGLYHPEDAEQGVGETFIRKWNEHPAMEVVSAGKKWLNICQRGIHKRSGVEELMQKYGIQRDEVLAFGDNMNDYAMLSFLPNSVAVKNARKEILAEFL